MESGKLQSLLDMVYRLVTNFQRFKTEDISKPNTVQFSGNVQKVLNTNASS